jgi:ClpX C4-type zinc finger
VTNEHIHQGCSFCGRTEAQVEHLVPGPDVAICDRCIEDCQKILSSKRGPQETSPTGSVTLTVVNPVAPEGNLHEWNPLSAFFEEAKRYPPLPHARREELLGQARSGDMNALNDLVRAQLEPVGLLALAVRPPSLQPVDAIQEAILLLKELITDESIPEPTLALATRLATRLAGTAS